MADIKSKKFDTLDKLNEFKKENQIKIISIETVKGIRDTGLPLFGRYGNFTYEVDVLKVFYEEIL